MSACASQTPKYFSLFLPLFCSSFHTLYPSHLFLSMESSSDSQSSSDEFDDVVDSSDSSSRSPSKESSVSHQDKRTTQTPSTEASPRHRRTPQSRRRAVPTSRYFDSEVDLTCELCGQTGHASFHCPIFNRTCFLCGGRDHIQSSCPNEFCFNCLLPGHHARACRQQSARFVICSRCGLRGHLAKNCPQRLFGVYPSQFKDAHCLWCERKGHIDCSGKMLAASSLKPKTPSCYLCGEKGHSGIVRFHDYCYMTSRAIVCLLFIPSFLWMEI
jgi:hypothetical protein